MASPYQAKTYGSGDSLCDDGIHCEESEDKRVDWDEYRKWLEKEFRPKTAYDRIHYSQQYAHCLFDKDFKPLLQLSQDKRAHVMNALSALSKFLGIHEQFSALIKNYGLKWSVRSDDLLIARFTKSVDPNDVFNWIKPVKEHCVELCYFMDFMATTGLRFEEAIQSHNLIVKLSREGKLDQYYDSEREFLSILSSRKSF